MKLKRTILRKGYIERHGKSNIQVKRAGIKARRIHKYITTNWRIHDVRVGVLHCEGDYSEFYSPFKSSTRLTIHKMSNRKGSS